MIWWKKRVRKQTISDARVGIKGIVWTKPDMDFFGVYYCRTGLRVHLRHLLDQEDDEGDKKETMCHCCLNSTRPPFCATDT